MRIVIAEDSVLLRAGIASLLEEAGHEVVAAAGDGDALIDAVDRQLPDLAVVDVRMPPSFTDEGLRAALTVRAQHPSIGILVLSQYVEERYAAELLATQTSGVGYLLKDRVADVREFLDALPSMAIVSSCAERAVTSSGCSAVTTSRCRCRDPCGSSFGAKASRSPECAVPISPPTAAASTSARSRDQWDFGHTAGASMRPRSEPLTPKPARTVEM